MRDPAVERSLVGSAMGNSAWMPDLVGLCQASDFYDPRLGQLWDAVCGLLAEGGGGTFNLGDFRRHVGASALEAVGGEAMLVALLAERTATKKRAIAHAVRVRQMAQVRRFGEAAGEFCDRHRDAEDPIAFLDEAASELVPLMRGEAEGPRLLAGRMTEIMAEIDKGRMRGVASGCDGLDRMTLGLRRGGLIVLGARPGMGKSALALGIADDVAERGVPVIVFSLEMSEREQVVRLLARRSLTAARKIETREGTQLEREAVGKAAVHLDRARIAIDDSEDLTISQLRARARAFHREHCAAKRGEEPKDMLVVVDYLQLMTIEKPSGSRDQDIGVISRGLKKLARELKCPVIALSQLNRGVEARNPPRPHMGDLRESGNIEQDADVILLQWRPDVYDKSTKRAGQAEVIVGKQRNGATGSFWLDWLGECYRFENRAKNDDDVADPTPKSTVPARRSSRSLYPPTKPDAKEA